MNDLAIALSAVVASLAFVSGVSAWKREFVGKRRIELAESVLALFYQAEDAIREIRSPFASSSEGKTRVRGDYEGEEEAQLLDRAYIVFERYQRREALFAELRSTRYRFMAAFGREASASFDELSHVVNEIFAAARILGTHYWPREGRVSMSDEQFDRHLAEMHRHEAIFWYMGDDEDKVSPRVRRAVERVEEITRREVEASQARGWLNFARARLARTRRA